MGAGGTGGRPSPRQTGGGDPVIWDLRTMCFGPLPAAKPQPRCRRAKNCRGTPHAREGGGPRPVSEPRGIRGCWAHALGGTHKDEGGEQGREGEEANTQGEPTSKK